MEGEYDTGIPTYPDTTADISALREVVSDQRNAFARDFACGIPFK